MVNLSAVRLVATGLVLAVFVLAGLVSLSAGGSPTYWFPGFVAVAGIAAAGYSLTRDLLRLRKGESILADEMTDLGASVTDAEEGDGATDAGTSVPDGQRESSSIPRRVLTWSLWLVALPVLAMIVPFFYASLIWLVAVLRVSGKRSWVMIGVSVAVFAVVLNVLIVVLAIRMPPALLTGWG